MTDPIVGASTWALANQIWIATIGTLIVKEAKEVIHRKIWCRSLNYVVGKGGGGKENNAGIRIGPKWEH